MEKCVSWLNGRGRIGMSDQHGLDEDRAGDSTSEAEYARDAASHLADGAQWLQPAAGDCVSADAAPLRSSRIGSSHNATRLQRQKTGGAAGFPSELRRDRK